MKTTIEEVKEKMKQKETKKKKKSTTNENSGKYHTKNILVTN